MSNQNVTAMKRIVLIILMVLLPMCVWCFETITIDGVTYKYEAGGGKDNYLRTLHPEECGCTIWDVYGDLPETLVMPDSIDGYKVTRIEADWEQQETNEVKRVVLPFYCRYVGARAFQKFSNLESVVMETHLEYIVMTAFENCTKLNSITTYALTPPSSTVISDYDRRERTRVKPFPDSVYAQATLHVRPGRGEAYKASVEWADFANVDEMDMPDGRDGDIRTGYVDGVPYLYTILSAADKTCMFGKELENTIYLYPFVEPYLVWRDYANWQAVRSFTDVDTLAIPAVIDGYTVTELGYKCLVGPNVSYKHVIIPETITTIRGDINGTTNVGTMNIPASVTYIGPNASRAYSYTVDPENPVYDSRNDCGSIIHTATNKLVRLGISQTIPEGVEAIGESALAYCYYWNQIPASVRQIDAGGFALTGRCTVVIPDFMTDLPDFLFYYSSAECIELHENVRSIGIDALVGYGGFLTTIVARSETPPELNNLISSNVTVYVPDGAIDTYKATPGWDNAKAIKGLSEYLAGIGTTDAEESAPAIYTLSGVRLSAPPAKGLYIVNGKKVLAR